MLPNNFKPFKSNKQNLIRVGPKRDGGYIIDKRIIINSKKFFVNKKKSTKEYPILGLDYKNLKRREDIKLKFND